MKSFEIEAQSATIVSRPANRRPGEHALECYEVEGVCQILNVELPRERNVIIYREVAANRKI